MKTYSLIAGREDSEGYGHQWETPMSVPPTTSIKNAPIVVQINDGTLTPDELYHYFMKLAEWLKRRD